MSILRRFIEADPVEKEEILEMVIGKAIDKGDWDIIQHLDEQDMGGEIRSREEYIAKFLEAHTYRHNKEFNLDLN